jgi:prolyl oligopeptidase
MIPRTAVALLVFAFAGSLLVPVVRAELPLDAAPPARISSAGDDYFGTRIPDPYRWLEDESTPETQSFIAAQNARTHKYLDTPQRIELKRRITELFDYPHQSQPARKGKYVFFTTNSGLQNQSVLHVTERVGDAGRVLIDPNQWSRDGTAFLSFTSYTKDGTLMAYGVAQSGSDHSEIHVMDVAAGRELPDVIPPARMGSVEWKHDNSGFYYGKYPRTTEHGRSEQAYGYRLYFHKLGTPPESDELIYERPDDKELSFGIDITDDGRYELLRLNRGTKRENRLYWRQTGAGAQWNKLIDDEAFTYDPIDNDGSVLYVRTTNNASRGRVIAVDLEHPNLSSWKDVIPRRDDVLAGARLIGQHFIASWIHDAHDLVTIHDLDGNQQSEVIFPTIGSIGAISGRREDSDFFYTFTSFSYPSTVFRHDLKQNSHEQIFQPKVKFDPAEYETDQIFATSKDGTKVPVFVTHRKGMTLDGGHKCILSGYGGFNISRTPSFSSSRVAWLERGGVFAEACMRGGGEYGEDWHKAGMFEKKQNVFDDFIAAAEALIARKYTSSKRLAIQGGSNGGLLVAACMLQRPQLYGAVVCQVPVADMLRYQKLGIGRFWTVEYGNADASADQFHYLRAYSPLHNVKPGVAYPPVLITTGEGDNRVVPGHSYKFAATLQASGSPNPVLLRIESKAGHGGGKPTAKIIDETADIYTFLDRTLESN